MAKITQADIAKQLGVSRVTISKALKGDSDISIEMKKKIRHLADELGYIPNYHASNLQAKKTRTIGVIIPDISISFFSHAIHGIMDVANKYNYHIILAASREDCQVEKDNILTMLSMRVDGLIVSVSKKTTSADIFTKVLKTDTPIIFFDRALPDIPIKSVGINDYEAAFKLTDYLISKGHKRIAHLGGTQTISVGRDRTLGYIDSLKNSRLSYDPDLYLECGFTRIDGYNGFLELYHKNSNFDAVYTANDRLAQGVYLACKKLGVKIPEDIAVAALGHTEFASILSPELTIMNWEPKDLGICAMQELLKLIENSNSNNFERINLDTELVVNESA